MLCKGRGSILNKNRRNDFARAAPRSEAVDDHHAGLADGLVEGFLGADVVNDHFGGCGVKGAAVEGLEGRTLDNGS